MYIGKRFPFWGVVNWSRRYIFIFFFIDVIPIALFNILDWHWLAIPWQPISLIGIAVSFYLGFKNNSSYDRLWEARKIWGGIVNASRTFTIMSRDFVTNEFAKEKISDSELQEIHQSIIYRHIAWLKALSFQMRIPKPWEHNEKKDIGYKIEDNTKHDSTDFEQLKAYISEEEYAYLMTKGNRASHLLSMQSKALLQLKLKGQIEDFRHMELEKMLGEFYALQGKSERIKNFPFPRQYATVNYIFVWIFLFLLPLGMLQVFSAASLSYSWLALPFTLLVSWVFILMEMIGEYSENPFEGLHNDVPISSMARAIEIDIRQMLDEEDLPPPMSPVGQYGIMY